MNYSREVLGKLLLSHENFKSCVATSSKVDFQSVMGDHSLEGMSVYNACFSYHNMSSMSYNGSAFLGCDFSLANLDDCDLSYCTFVDCVFAMTSFRGTNMQNCRMEKCLISACDFQGANIPQMLQGNNIFSTCVFDSTVAYSTLQCSARLWAQLECYAPRVYDTCRSISLSQEARQKLAPKVSQLIAADLEPSMPSVERCVSEHSSPKRMQTC